MKSNIILLACNIFLLYLAFPWEATAENVDKSIVNMSLSELENSEKVNDFDVQLMLTLETGRLTEFMLYKGNNPIEIAILGNDFNPIHKVYAEISDVNSAKYKDLFKDPNKMDADGFTLSPGQTPMGRWDDSRLRGHYPKVDKIYTLKKGEIIGSSCHVWDLSIWKRLGECLKKYNKSYLVNIAPLKASLDNFHLPEYEIKIDIVLYNKLEDLRKKYEAVQKVKGKDGRIEIKHTPREEVDGKKEYPPFKMEADFNRAQDHSGHLQFDERTGRLISYLLFDGTIYLNHKADDPDFVRDSEQEYKTFDSDVINDIMNIKADTVAYIYDYYSSNEAYSNNESMEMAYLEYDAPPKKQAETLDRKITLKNETYVFGSFCYIWEIEIWKTLGEKIKKMKKPYYLVSSASLGGIQGTFLPDYCVKIDEELYNKMESLRKYAEGVNPH